MLDRQPFELISEAYQPGDILLAMSAPLTGKHKALGLELYRGAAAYFRYCNEKKLFGGQRIILLARDDQYKPFQTIKNTRSFVHDNNIKALCNYVGTPTLVAALPISIRPPGRNGRSADPAICPAQWSTAGSQFPGSPGVE